MVQWNDVKNDPNARKILDYGFIVLKDTMGSDETIAESARVSYGEGTQSITNNENLIRYLLRHRHTTPFEMCEARFLIKMPIFVARQWIRHRTASVNEYSGRYSIMSNEFYVPEPENIKPQSVDNKQGRDGKLSDKHLEGARRLFNEAFEHANSTYHIFLGESERDFYDFYDPSSSRFDDDFDGIARELARTVLPVSNYTELYWKANLHNIFHLMKLRMDPHAQYEIRVYAEAMYDLLKPYFPIALKAFDDYINGAVTLSKMEYELVKHFFNETKWQSYFPNETFEDTERKRHGMSKREWIEFKSGQRCRLLHESI